MTGDPARVPAPRQASSGVLQRAGRTVYTGQARADPVMSLAVRMRPTCRRAIDVDEVAAVLEASGINDGVATREYGHTSVFALAAAVLEHTPPRDPAT